MRWRTGLLLLFQPRRREFTNRDAPGRLGYELTGCFSRFDDGRERPGVALGGESTLVGLPSVRGTVTHTPPAPSLGLI